MTNGFYGKTALAALSFFLAASCARAQQQAEPAAPPPAPSQQPAPVKQRTIIWWGLSGFEINIDGKVLMLDPVFGLFRRADYVLCSGTGRDHDSFYTRKRIAEVSPDITLAAAPVNVKQAFGGPPKERTLLPNDSYEDDFFSIRAVRGEADTGSETAYLVKDKKYGLTFFHAGQAASKNAPAIQKALSEAGKLDYYLYPLGTMDDAALQQVLAAAKPAHFVPCGYIYSQQSMTFPNGKDTIPPYRTGYREDKKKLDSLTSSLNAFFQKAQLPTKILSLFPGNETAL